METLNDIIRKGEGELGELLDKTVLNLDENWATKNKEDIKSFLRSQAVKIVEGVREEVEAAVRYNVSDEETVKRILTALDALTTLKEIEK